MKFTGRNTGIITQARMTSTRLPGKVLMEINGKSLLQYHIERLQNSGLELAIATTTNSSDDSIADFGLSNNIRIFRGSEQNVLQRYIQAADIFDYNIIVRVTSDCPLIDGALIKNAVDEFIQAGNEWLYVSNVVIRSFARGFDFEIFSIEALRDAYKNAKNDSELEHVTPYIRNNKSGKIIIHNIVQPQDNSIFRLTVDTPEDFQLIKELIEKYHADKMSYADIESLLSNHPELVEINRHIAQKEI